MANALRASWGVTDSVSSVSGVVVGIDLGAEGSFINETDLYGRVCAVFMYDVISTFGVDVQVRAGTTPPNIGSQMNVAGNIGYVKDARITESNSSYQKMHVTVEKTTLVDHIGE